MVVAPRSEGLKEAGPRARLLVVEGFSLIELLVVVLIIGILATIALPAFLGQQEKAEDGQAKSNAGNLVAQVETCHTEEEDYGRCEDEEKPPLSDSGLPLGSAAGEAEVVDDATDGNSYEVVGYSKSGNTFTIEKENGRAPERSCTDADKGGCPSDGAW